MTSVTAPARSAATSEDFPTPASPEIRTMCPGFGERSGDGRAMAGPTDVGDHHRPGHPVILPRAPDDVQDTPGSRGPRRLLGPCRHSTSRASRGRRRSPGPAAPPATGSRSGSPGTASGRRRGGRRSASTVTALARSASLPPRNVLHTRAPSSAASAVAKPSMYPPCAAWTGSRVGKSRESVLPATSTVPASVDRDAEPLVLRGAAEEGAEVQLLPVRGEPGDEAVVAEFLRLLRGARPGWPARPARAGPSGSRPTGCCR